MAELNANFGSETGEGLEIMPGSTVALTQELEPFPLSFLTDMDDSSEPYGEWRPQFLIPIIQVSLPTSSTMFVHSTAYCTRSTLARCWLNSKPNTLTLHQ